MHDPIVEEVRRIRMAHTKRFDGDLTAICKDLRDIQKTCGHKIVRLPAKRIERMSPPTRKVVG